jgi:hypothetical protein
MDAIEEQMNHNIENDQVIINAVADRVLGMVSHYGF